MYNSDPYIFAEIDMEVIWTTEGTKFGPQLRKLHNYVTGMLRLFVVWPSHLYQTIFSSGTY